MTIRLLRAISSDLPFPTFLVAEPGIYGPERLQVNAHGAVSVWAGNGWLGVKPDEFEVVTK